MTILAKICARCKQELSLTDFYIRSGNQSPTEPGHYLSECKRCMKSRSQAGNHLPAFVPRAKTEILAIDALKKAGIGAVPGKAVAAADVDVVAWGHIWIEVKHAHLECENGKSKFTFTSTPKQMQRGYLAQIVMLICDYRDGRITYHLFESDDPVFYIHGRIKSGFTFTPGAMTAMKHSNNRIVMVQPMMDAAENNWRLIETVRQRIALQLASG